MVLVNTSLHTLAILAMLVCYGVETLVLHTEKCNTDLSIQSFVDFG